VVGGVVLVEAQLEKAMVAGCLVVAMLACGHAWGLLGKRVRAGYA